MRVLLLRHDAGEAATNQGSEIREDSRQGKAPGRGEVGGLPDRIVLVLVLAKALEVIEVLAESISEGADALPDRAEVAVLETRQGGHSHVEPVEALLLAPEEHVGEHVIHHAVDRLLHLSHQVEGELFALTAFPDGGECLDCAFRSHDGNGKAADVILAEGTEREALLSRLLLAEPGDGDASEIRKDCRDNVDL